MSRTFAIGRARTPAVVAIALGLLVGIASVASADEEQPPDGPPAPPEDSLTMNDFIFAPDADDFIVRFDPDDFIDRLGTPDYEEREDSEEDNVIVLEADILFRSNEWELPSSANAKIAELVEEIPEGASVQVHGHTDSLPVDESQFDFDNQELSESRAEAVADVLSDERSDLSLDVEGFGDSQPAVDEDEEDPSTFAANRRVEIRYD